MFRWILGLVVWSVALPVLADAPMFRTSGQAVAGEYIVVFEDPYRAADMAEQMTTRIGGEVMRTFEQAIVGVHVRMTRAQVAQTIKMPGVLWVEENAVVSLSAPVAQAAPANNGLDRIDQRQLPLNRSYQVPSSGERVNIYVIDTGINPTHVEFEGRASVGADLIGDGRNGIDCNGHGTHVAGISGSREYGVAKDANLIGVRVFGCTGGTSTAIIVAGVDWVVRNFVRPAVVNMSLGGPPSPALDSSVARAVGAGIFVAVAAGNENQDACNVSPARAPSAFAVGSTVVNDQRSSFSNFGSCVRLFAPGSQITSTWFRSPTDINTISGTSMASPHVAGAAALVLEQNPSLSPGAVGQRLLADATPGVVQNAGPGSPNLLLYVAAAQGGGGMQQMPFTEDFNDGPGPFTYQDDVFGTGGPPQYASGAAVATGGVNNSGAVRVRLGGVDNATVTNMSGGYVLDFQLGSPAQVQLQLVYSVTQSASYESDERSVAAVSIDGNLVDVFGEVTGNGNGGAPISTGLQTRTVSLGSLGAGAHTLAIGAFNNKKTLNDEFTDFILDNVSIGVVR